MIDSCYSKYIIIYVEKAEVMLLPLFLGEDVMDELMIELTPKMTKEL